MMETAHSLQKMGSIYVLRDPETLEIRYVGKTTQTLKYRLMYHIRDSKKYSHYAACWIKGLIKKGLKPTICLVESCPTIILNSQEMFWIKVCRKYCKLTNLTDGGDGNSNQFRSAESKLKIGHTIREKVKSGEIVYDSVRRQRISEALKGKIVSIETREKLRAINIGKKQSSETILKRFRTAGKPIVLNGLIFPSIRKGAEAFNLDENKVWRKCNGKNVRDFPFECTYQVTEDIVESL